MSGKEGIIAGILENAEAEKNRLLAKAEYEVNAIKAADEEFFKNSETRKNNEIAENDLSIISRRKSVAELDVRKQLLLKKKEKLDEVFSLAVKEIISDTKAYESFLKQIIKSYAEDGDRVIINKADEKRLTKSDVNTLADEKGIKLSYSTDGTQEGGIILEGKTSDKNITLEILLKEFRDENESRIAEILFGE